MKKFTDYSIWRCQRECDKRKKCQSFDFSKEKKECHIYNVDGKAIYTGKTSGSYVDQDCFTKKNLSLSKGAWALTNATALLAAISLAMTM